jgi:hypothetical protein
MACLVGLVQENISLLAKTAQFPLGTQAAWRVKASASFNVLMKESPLKNNLPGICQFMLQLVRATEDICQPI